MNMKSEMRHELDSCSIHSWSWWQLSTEIQKREPKRQNFNELGLEPWREGKSEGLVASLLTSFLTGCTPGRQLHLKLQNFQHFLKMVLIWTSSLWNSYRAPKTISNLLSQHWNCLSSDTNVSVAKTTTSAGTVRLANCILLMTWCTLFPVWWAFENFRSGSQVLDLILHTSSLAFTGEQALVQFVVRDSRDSQYPKFWGYWESRSPKTPETPKALKFWGFWESRESRDSGTPNTLKI